jgi:cytochrome c-type biogenesis protein CcsB
MAIVESAVSTNENAPDSNSPEGREAAETALRRTTDLRKLLLPLASLKITVALFAFSIFLVLAGTLAQWRKEVWQVVDEYFRVWFAFIEFQDLFPRTLAPWFPSWVKGGFYAPGGWLIGGAMFVNLLAAHALRFTVQARGMRLWAGLGVLALGVVSTAIVVSDDQGLSGLRDKPVDYSTLWLLCKTLLVMGCFGGGYAYTRLQSGQRIERWTVAILTALLTGLTGWVLAQGGEFRLGDSSMRILWQLIQGTVASLILLAGCWMLFNKRSGIVLLHAGILLMMTNEVVVHQLHHEGQITLHEGDTRNYVEDSRSIELAVVNRSDAKVDRHVVVPKDLLVEGVVVTHADLPFDLKIEKFFKNSDLRERKDGEQVAATMGTGLKWVPESRPPVTGTDGAGKVDESAAYLVVLKKGTTESLGTLLVGLRQSLREVDEMVTVDGKEYALSLRLPRAYRPYSVHLIDVRRDNYVGTTMVKNYSSDVRLVDTSRQVDKEVKIWMNNPLRFAGETFYQSGYDADSRGEYTVLQVVRNTGWMIPYVSCMIVATGMLAQFLITLSRFLNRHERAAVAAQPALDAQPARRATLLLPVIVMAVTAILPLSKLMPKAAPEDKFDFDAAGRIPVVYEGRIKPLDTLARNTLRIISESETVLDPADKERKKRVTAMKWFLDVISGAEIQRKYEVLRVRHPDLVTAIGLEKRSGWRYSMDEIVSQMAEASPESKDGESLPPQTKLERQAQLADDQSKKVGAALLTSDQKAAVSSYRNAQLLMLMVMAFNTDRLPELPSREVFMADADRARGMAMNFLRAQQMIQERLKEYKAPLAVPRLKSAGAESAGESSEVEWEPYLVAHSEGLVRETFLQETPDTATQKWNEMLAAYRKGDVRKFNTTVREYLKWVGEQPIPEYRPARTNFEAAFNRANPFFDAWVLYLGVTVLALLGWLLNSPAWNRAAFWMTVVTLVVHTVGLIGRMYISGRPPVTNLYSSAVFIGWGTVLLGLIFEAVYRRGVGNVLAGLTGLSSLHIAWVLSLDADTFTVLQAVLDTQFWLATHVVSVTLGYSTTFVAGFFGILYVLRRLFFEVIRSSAKLAPDVRQRELDTQKDLARMIYGSLCFALFFSFVGTVLGGLWADDSWGRFWGWDPKENGALIIVLWNALILHARWGAMIKERGLALLAIAGNITTAWSWFGVNELGIGLHSYGFTEGVLMTLGIFGLTQVALIVAGGLLRTTPKTVSVGATT